MAPEVNVESFRNDPDNGPFYGEWCILWSAEGSSRLRLASGFLDETEATEEAERRQKDHQVIWRICECAELIEDDEDDNN
jgi:hypothetical protein